MVDGVIAVVTDKPCPNCGRAMLKPERRASQEPYLLCPEPMCCLILERDYAQEAKDARERARLKEPAE